MINKLLSRSGRTLQQLYGPDPIHPGLLTRTTLGFAPDSGKPEAFAVYKKGEQEYGFTFDLFFAPVRAVGSLVVDVPLVVTLCPRCNGSLLIRSNRGGLNGQHGIDVDYGMLLRGIDNCIRPAITIIGPPIACDYFDEEHDGVAGPRHVRKCGWKGVVERGRIYDYTPTRLEIVRG